MTKGEWGKIDSAKLLLGAQGVDFPLHLLLWLKQFLECVGADSMEFKGFFGFFTNN